MAYLPISKSVPQYSTSSNELADGYYLKGYIAGTTTALSMATDENAGTLIAKCKIGAKGYPLSDAGDESSIFIPYFNRDYKLVLYKNDADADADNTGAADWVVDNIKIGTTDTFSALYTVGASNSIVSQVANSSAAVGDIYESNYYDSNLTSGSGAKWKCVALGTTPPDGTSGINSDGYLYSAASNASKWEVVGSPVSVLWFGADPSGASSCVALINNLSTAGYNLEFPEGQYLLDGTINGGVGYWQGAGQGNSLYSSTFDGSSSVFMLSGTNSGNPFVKPPKKFSGFRIEGDSKQGVGIALGQDGAFTGFQDWSDITVRSCEVGIDCFNYYSVSWNNVYVQDCIKGIRMEPADTAADDGYWTATDWTNVHIADCDLYGLSAVAPLGTRTFSWRNVVIERNATDVSAVGQAIFSGVTLIVNGVYLEGTSSKPAVYQSGTLSMYGGWLYFNGTGGWDANGQTARLEVNQLSMANASDVFSNLNSNCRLSLAYSSIQTDLRQGSYLVDLRDVYISSVALTVSYRSQYLSVGKAPSASYQPGEARLLYFGQKTYSGTINANSKQQIVTNHYFPGIFTNAVGAGSVNTYHPGLIVNVTPANTSNANYFCVELINTTGSNITLTSENVTIMIWCANNPEAL